jgi:hypothetical protein
MDQAELLRQHRANVIKTYELQALESLKPPMDERKGGSLNSFLTDVALRTADKLWPVRTEIWSDVSKLVKEHSSLKINTMWVCREPIKGALKTAINAFTLGKLKSNQKRLNYDEIYHLFLVMRTEKGLLVTEKNEVIELKWYRKAIPVDHRQVNCDTTLGEVWSSMLSDKDFTVRYSPEKDNCQQYIGTLLKANGLLSQALKSYVFQDAQELLAGASPQVTAMNDVTNLASRFHRFRHGKGLQVPLEKRPVKPLEPCYKATPLVKTLKGSSVKMPYAVRTIKVPQQHSGLKCMKKVNGLVRCLDRLKEKEVIEE